MKISEAKGILACPMSRESGCTCTADACCWWRPYNKDEGDCIINDIAYNIGRIADNAENAMNYWRWQ